MPAEQLWPAPPSHCKGTAPVTMDPMLKFNRAVPADRLRLLIFDLDGTLVDSRLDLTNSVNAMLRHLRRPELPSDVIASYVGDGTSMLVRRALGDPDDDMLFKTGLDYFLSYYREHKLDHTHVYPGALDALRQIQAADTRSSPIVMTVLTNKPVVPSRAIVEALGLNGFFARIYGGNSFPTKKPDPMGVQTLMHEFGVQPVEVLVIGDSDVDVLTGRNVGAWTCGVRYGFDPSRLEKAPPDILVDSPRELPLIFSPSSQSALNAEEFRNLPA